MHASSPAKILTHTQRHKTHTHTYTQALKHTNTHTRVVSLYLAFILPPFCPTSFCVQSIDGSRVERILELVHIAANKNTVPGGWVCVCVCVCSGCACVVWVGVGGWVWGWACVCVRVCVGGGVMHSAIIHNTMPRQCRTSYTRSFPPSPLAPSPLATLLNLHRAAERFLTYDLAL